MKHPLINYINELSENYIGELLVEAKLGTYKYRPPEDKEELMYDFYLLTLMDKSEDEDIEYALRDTKNTLIPFLKKELLQAVYFSVTAEIRHIIDQVHETPIEINKSIRKNLGSKYEKIFKKYLINFITQQKLGKEFTDPDLQKPRRKLLNNANSYVDSYNASLKSTKNKKDFIKIAEFIFDGNNFHWSRSYGGENWRKIAESWLNLNDIPEKDFNKTNVWIDRVYDLQHNTDTVFNKLKSYYKDGSYKWIKKALDKKAAAKTPYEIFDNVSPQMKRLAGFYFHNAYGTSFQDWVDKNESSEWEMDPYGVFKKVGESKEGATYTNGDKIKIGDVVETLRAYPRNHIHSSHQKAKVIDILDLSVAIKFPWREKKNKPNIIYVPFEDIKLISSPREQEPTPKKQESSDFEFKVGDLVTIKNTYGVNTLGPKKGNIDWIESFENTTGLNSEYATLSVDNDEWNLMRLHKVFVGDTVIYAGDVHTIVDYDKDKKSVTIKDKNGFSISVGVKTIKYNFDKNKEKPSDDQKKENNDFKVGDKVKHTESGDIGTVESIDAAYTDSISVSWGRGKFSNHYPEYLRKINIPKIKGEEIGTLKMNDLVAITGDISKNEEGLKFKIGWVDHIYNKGSEEESIRWKQSYFAPSYTYITSMFTKVKVGDHLLYKHYPNDYKILSIDNDKWTINIKQDKEKSSEIKNQSVVDLKYNYELNSKSDKESTISDEDYKVGDKVKYDMSLGSNELKGKIGTIDNIGKSSFAIKWDEPLKSGKTISSFDIKDLYKANFPKVDDKKNKKDIEYFKKQFESFNKKEVKLSNHSNWIYKNIDDIELKTYKSHPSVRYTKSDKDEIKVTKIDSVDDSIYFESLKTGKKDSYSLYAFNANGYFPLEVFEKSDNKSLWFDYTLDDIQVGKWYKRTVDKSFGTGPNIPLLKVVGIKKYYDFPIRFITKDNQEKTDGYRLKSFNAYKYVLVDDPEDIKDSDSTDKKNEETKLEEYILSLENLIID